MDAYAGAAAAAAAAPDVASAGRWPPALTLGVVSHGLSSYSLLNNVSPVPALFWHEVSRKIHAETGVYRSPRDCAGKFARVFAQYRSLRGQGRSPASCTYGELLEPHLDRWRSEKSAKAQGRARQERSRARRAAAKAALATAKAAAAKALLTDSDSDSDSADQPRTGGAPGSSSRHTTSGGEAGTQSLLAEFLSAQQARDQAHLARQEELLCHIVTLPPLPGVPPPPPPFPDPTGPSYYPPY